MAATSFPGFRCLSQDRSRAWRDSRARSALRRRRLLRHDAHDVVDDLKKPAVDVEPPSALATHAQDTLAEESHQRRVAGENAHLAVERRRDDRVGRALVQHGLGRDDGDVEHASQPCSFFAFSTTSSMPPAMKNACSGRLSNSPATSRSTEEIVSSSFTYLPLIPVNCSATENGCDMKR